MAKKRSLQKQKPKPKARPRNRYVVGAKLSEYRFLKILKGFSSATPVKELHSESGISERTIRDTYWQLRRKLYEAVMTDKASFNNAGRYLFPKGQITYHGTLLMEAVADSGAFADLIDRQYPGNKAPTEEQVGLLVFEMGVRVLCKSPSMTRKLTEASEPMVKSHSEARAIIAEIERVQEDPANRWKAGGLRIELEHKLMELDLLKVQQNLQAVTADHRQGIDPSYMIFTQLRRYLAKSPVQNTPQS